MNFAQALERSCQAERAEESPRQRTLALPHFCKRGSDRRGPSEPNIKTPSKMEGVFSFPAKASVASAEVP